MATATGIGSTDAGGYFDPCSLHVLAEHMRDGRWLDVRTDDGLIQRVRIVEIVVRVKGEDIVFRQEWLEGDDDDVTRYKHQFAVDSEAIWRVLPTNYHIEQVRPWCYDHDLPEVESELKDEETVLAIKVVIGKALEFWKVSLDQLRDTGKWEYVDARYAVVLVLFEVTNLSPQGCCEAVGYRSPQPLVSARARLRYAPRTDPGDRDYIWAGKAREFAKRCDGVLGRGFRSVRIFPTDYRPLLER